MPAGNFVMSTDSNGGWLGGGVRTFPAAAGDWAPAFVADCIISAVATDTTHAMRDM
jgi:hypothetical protein